MYLLVSTYHIHNVNVKFVNVFMLYLHILISFIIRMYVEMFNLLRNVFL